MGGSLPLPQGPELPPLRSIQADGVPLLLSLERARRRGSLLEWEAEDGEAGRIFPTLA